MSTLCNSCGFPCQQGVLKTLPGPGHLRSGGWGSLTVAFTGRFVCIYIYIYIYIYVESGYIYTITVLKSYFAKPDCNQMGGKCPYIFCCTCQSFTKL